MLKKKKSLAKIAIILFIVGISIIFSSATRSSDKGENNKNAEITYELSFKVNPLIKFEFKYTDDKAIINNFELINDKAREIFKEMDFINMDLNEAIDIYGDGLKKNEIIFSTINVFTNWDNKDYFKSKKYNINVEIVDTEFLEDIEENTSEELVLNKKYYKLENNFKYDYIVFKEDGKMEYSVDGVVFETDSDVYPHHYTLEDDSVMLRGNEMRGYFGWIFSHDECKILYEKIACDYYLDTNYDLKEEFIRTEYYEIGK